MGRIRWARKEYAVACKWIDALVGTVDREIEREIDRIWSTLREQQQAISGIAVLQVQMGQVMKELGAIRQGRKWAVAQTIGILSILATVIGSFIQRG